MTATQTRRPRQSREDRNAKLTALAARLDAFAASADDDDLAIYEARFDNYSPRNAMAIVMQMPEATVVRGFHAWNDEGRRVRKGEHGIQILAPAGSRTKEGPRTEATDTAPATTTEDKVRRFFRIAYVFDISQTDAAA
jgi:hypothetical protein